MHKLISKDWVFFDEKIAANRLPAQERDFTETAWFYFLAFVPTLLAVIPGAAISDIFFTTVGLWPVLVIPSLFALLFFSYYKWYASHEYRQVGYPARRCLKQLDKLDKGSLEFLPYHTRDTIKNLSAEGLSSPLSTLHDKISDLLRIQAERDYQASGREARLEALNERRLELMDKLDTETKLWKE